jgi:hypothetical protein
VVRGWEKGGHRSMACNVLLSEQGSARGKPYKGYLTFNTSPNVATFNFTSKIGDILPAKRRETCAGQTQPPCVRRLETCAACPNGQYSEGGKEASCTLCQNMEFGYFCSGAIKTVCPTAENDEGDPTLACVNGEIQSAIGQGLDKGKLTPWYPAIIHTHPPPP